MDLQAKIAEIEGIAAARIQQIEQRVADERAEAEDRIRQAEERIRRNEQKAAQERAQAEERIRQAEERLQQIQQSFVQEKKSHELDLLLEILKRVSSCGSKSESQQRSTLEGGINFNNDLFCRPAVLEKTAFLDLVCDVLSVRSDFMPNQLFDNLKAWKETAALITCKKNYNSESSCYADVFNLLKLVDERWLAAKPSSCRTRWIHRTE
jgi:predicted house-cleaning noncanonical NTP pyrophosphatase (MazG superfamily)